MRERYGLSLPLAEGCDVMMVDVTASMVTSCFFDGVERLYGIEHDWACEYVYLVVVYCEEPIFGGMDWPCCVWTMGICEDAREKALGVLADRAYVRDFRVRVVEVWRYMRRSARMRRERKEDLRRYVERAISDALAVGCHG